MLVVKKVSQKRWVKCCSCREQIRSFEPYFVVQRPTGVNVSGEIYCPDCEDIAYENNPDAVSETSQHEPDEGRVERMREAYGAYDSKEAFWRDADAGYFD